MEFTARNDGTIWACGRRNLTAKLPPSGLSTKPDEEMIEELKDRARTWLFSDYKCIEKHTDRIELVSKGRAFRPATKSGLPVISEVKASDLTCDTIETTSREGSSGVYLGWGHGSYGLTLGMGTGKVMGQVMHGENPDLDLSLFALKQDHDMEKGHTFLRRSQEKL